MPVSDRPPSLARLTSLLPLLALTGCAAISQDVVTVDGKPCNAFCQGWMGLPRSGHDVAVPTSPVPPVRRPKAVLLRRRGNRRALSDDGDDPAKKGRDETTKVLPSIEPAKAVQPPSLPVAPINRWGMQIPGSALTPSDAGFVQP